MTGPSSVLVVEDHVDLREMLAILLDLMMPVMTGDEFRERQLADSRYAHVPVICMTAAHDGKERAERLHADEYFQKPVDFEQLLNAVRSHCHH